MSGQKRMNVKFVKDAVPAKPKTIADEMALNAAERKRAKRRKRNLALSGGRTS